MAEYPPPITSVDDLPKNYDALPRERFWQQYWLEQGTYKFNPYVEDEGVRAELVSARSDEDTTEDSASTAGGDKLPPYTAGRRLKSRNQIFSIDTPPPTVSGQLHIGHVYSYTQTDMNARYRRMTGKHVFYPFGFDDNGLPTERLVEKEHGIRAHEVSREEFIALCQQTAARYEQEFIALWQSLALSCDWEQYYTTIDERSRAISQASFIDLYNKGYIYRKVAPTQWDWVNQTAIAQAEIEDREVPGHFHYIKFQWADGPGAPARGDLVIGTTRPELIPACVAVMVNPESEDFVHDHEGKPVRDFAGHEVKQRDLIGKIAITPLFEVEVPILPSEKADPEKGTGVLMCCTFGDMDDVEHWQRNWQWTTATPIGTLPQRIIFGKDGKTTNLSGRFVPASQYWDDADPRGAQTGSTAIDAHLNRIPSRSVSRADKFAATLTGLKPNQARAKVREDLQEAGLLINLQDIVHTVRFAERGDVPVEILVTPQWYVNLLEHKEELVAQGRKVAWHPAYMQKRYEQWVDGLNSDWCISRQRYNGVPFPVWYSKDHRPIVASTGQLPVNPIVSLPTEDVLAETNRITEERFGEDMIAVMKKMGMYPSSPDNIHPDTDVMDTWATSSVTPLLNTHFMPGAGGAGIPARDEKADTNVRPTDRHAQLFPFDMRPQAHDIIRTWAFYTIAKAYFHFGQIPWRDIVISGHAQDAGRQKMSKSKGNVVTPAQMVEKYSADGLRYWSGSVKLGTDTVYDETKLGEGRKLINKLFNGTKFALRHLLEFDPGVDSGTGALARHGAELEQATGESARPTALTNLITYPTDLWLISRLNACIERATAAHEAFEFGDAKQAVEDFFWADLCDNYLEFSKGRLYGEPLAVGAHPDLSTAELRRSAQATLYLAFSSVLRMLAPTLPHITEECWSWYFAQWSDKGSIHLEEWPRPIGVPTAGRRNVESEDALTGGQHSIPAELLLHTVAAVRKWKSERGVSIKTPLNKVVIYNSSPDQSITAETLAAVLGDLLSTCNAQQASLENGTAPDGAVTTERSPIAVVCELAPEAS